MYTKQQKISARDENDWLMTSTESMRFQSFIIKVFKFENSYDYNVKIRSTLTVTIFSYFAGTQISQATVIDFYFCTVLYI